MKKADVVDLLLKIVEELKDNSVNHGDVLCMSENMRTTQRWCSTTFISEVITKHLPQMKD